MTDDGRPQLGLIGGEAGGGAGNPTGPLHYLRSQVEEQPPVIVFRDSALLQTMHDRDAAQSALELQPNEQELPHEELRIARESGIFRHDDRHYFASTTVIFI